MKTVSYSYYNKNGDRIYYTEDKNEVYKVFSYSLRCKFFHKSPTYGRVTRTNNFDDTCTYTFIRDNGKSVFIVEE